MPVPWRPPKRPSARPRAALASLEADARDGVNGPSLWPLAWPHRERKTCCRSHPHWRSRWCRSVASFGRAPGCCVNSGRWQHRGSRGSDRPLARAEVCGSAAVVRTAASFPPSPSSSSPLHAPEPTQVRATAIPDQVVHGQSSPQPLSGASYGRWLRTDRFRFPGTADFVRRERPRSVSSSRRVRRADWSPEPRPNPTHAGSTKSPNSSRHFANR